MTNRYKPLTKKQLAEIVQCYASDFPEWRIAFGGHVLVRACGPIAQQIGFEALRSGPYRPSMALRALPLRTVCMLPQVLDVKHRQIMPRLHSAMWKSVVSAMEEQFRPSIRKQLDLQEIKSYCENELRNVTNDLCMLAILSAYLGEKDEALSYCERIEKAQPPTLAPRPDWERNHLEFGRQLQQAIKAGKELQFLQSASTDLD